MNKLNYLILLGIIPVWSFAQQITINPAPEPEDGYTPEYLVNEILIEGDCAQVDNITSPMNSSFDGEPYESYGYFEANGASFPFEDGVVLASNNVTTIPTNPAGGGWEGDADLTSLIGENTNNSTVLEFDFVPFVNEISFNYIMASDEYNDINSTFPPNYPCSFADVFAFIISGPYDADGNLITDEFDEGTPGVFESSYPYNVDANPNTPDVIVDLGGLNIATLPGTNIPATITNIHNIECGVGAAGEFAAGQFFDEVNSGNGAIGYNGQTIPIVASTPVIAGQIYKIKLAVADRLDTILNTAVFIEGESFTLGDIDLGDPISLEDPEAQCEGSPILADTGLPDDTEIVFEWFKGDLGSNPTELIEGAEDPSYEITETGSYCVFAFIPNPTGGAVACFNTGCIDVEFFTEPEVSSFEDGLICADGTTDLNATPDNLETLLEQDPEGPTYTWFLEGEEIDGETEAILAANSPGAYTVEVQFNSCLIVLEANLTQVEFEVALGDDQEFCVAVDEELSYEIVSELTDAEEDEVTYLWSTGETTPNITVDETGVYDLTVTYLDCEVTEEVEVVFLPIPDVNLEDIIVCEEGDVTIDATPSNIDEINAIDEEAITYTWFLNENEIANEENASIVVSEPGFYSVEVNFFSCSTTSEAELIIENYFVDLGDAPLPCVQEGETPEYTIVPEIVGVDDEDLELVEYEWSTGETTPTITVTESGTYSVTTTFNSCEEFDEIEINFVPAHQVVVSDVYEVTCFDEASVTIPSGYDFNNADEIIWETPNGTIVQDQSDLVLDWNVAASTSVAENEIVGTYTLTVIIGNCEVSTPFEVDFRRQSPAGSSENTGNIIESCLLPQGISPNGDGVNDCFDLSFLAMDPGIDKLQVFNRYGRKVFESNGYVNEFCGQDDGGNNLVTGTYFYVLNLSEAGGGFERVEKGWIYINREQQ